MAGREHKPYARKKVTYRLMYSQIKRLEDVSETIGKSKTAIVEEALALYFNMLKQNGVV